MNATASNNAEQETCLSFDEFPLPGKNAWRVEVEATLAGAQFEKKLVTGTDEGIDIQPIYRREDLESLSHLGGYPGLPPYVRGIRAGNSWEIAQEIPCQLPADYNQSLRSDLERGQTAVNIVFNTAPRDGTDAHPADDGDATRRGVSISTSADFDRILDGVEAGRFPLLLQPGPAPLSLFALLISHVRRSGRTPAILRGAILHDPLGELVADGTLPDSIQGEFDQMAHITKWVVREMPVFGTIGVRTDVYHNAGANAVQELAYALATGVQYLREMESRGLGPDEAASHMRFAFSIGTDFFMGIAKFRAARMLWSRIVSASGGSADAQKMRIHARTSIWNKTRLDPYVNMLRGTTEAFAAVAGGCESMHVGAFDEVIRPADEFSRRIARNTQLILRDECHFDHVIDPAGGSYYVETLTDQLAVRAWGLFQEIEKLGGMTKALLSGVPQQQVHATADKKAESIARRRTSIIGVNVYANHREIPLEPVASELTETRKNKTACAAGLQPEPGKAGQHALERLRQLSANRPDTVIDAAISAAAEGATLAELSRTLHSRSGELARVVPLHPLRASEPFEKLRAAVEAAGKPKVFLANMGPLRQHKARADFSTGFLQAGGFDVLENRGFQTVALAFEAAQKSGASVFVVCSTDETYPDVAGPFAGLIKASQPQSIVIVAGYPNDQIEALKSAGVDEFIHVRANCHEVLRNLATKLGINL